MTIILTLLADVVVLKTKMKEPTYLWNVIRKCGKVQGFIVWFLRVYILVTWSLAIKLVLNVIPMKSRFRWKSSKESGHMQDSCWQHCDGRHFLIESVNSNLGRWQLGWTKYNRPWPGRIKRLLLCLSCPIWLVAFYECHGKSSFE